MKVAIVSRIYAPEPAAAAFALRAVAERLRDLGHAVTVITTTAPGEFPDADTPGIRIRRAPVLRDRNGYVRGYLQYLSFDIPLAFRLLFGHRHDVYVVEPPPTTGAVTRVLLAVLRRPYVYDAADVWSDAVATETSSGFVRRALRWTERFALQGATAIVTISSGVADRIRELTVRTPVTVTGFGADVSVFRPEPGLPIQPCFVYAGSYSALHGAEIFLDAFALFRERRPGFRLRFIGNGVDREMLERRARDLGIEEVEFSQAIDPRSLAPILSSATASLASSRPETGYEYAFATKAYSSLATGCPVLFAGDGGPTAEFLQGLMDGGLAAGVVASYDADAVADAMWRLADTPHRPEDRERLARHISEEHSLAATADRIASVVSSVGRCR